MLQFINTKEIWKGEAINGVRHPRNIELLWTADDLAAIGLEKHVPAVIEPEPVDPLTIPLNPVQFQAMLGMTGKYDAIMTAVDGMAEPARSVSRAKINHSTSYSRDNELFANIGAVVGITDAEIDALWLQALEIE